MTIEPEGVEKLLARHLSERAVAQISFFRDDADSFQLNISPEGVVSKQDVMRLLPAGSAWNHLVGWRDFFGIPMRPSMTAPFCVGVSEVLGHSTRGATPALHAYIYVDARAVAPGLLSLANEIHAGPARHSGTHGVVWAASANPLDHRSVEAAILRCAAADYETNQPLLFHTLLMTGREVKVVVRWSQVLVATVPVATRKLPRISRWRLRAGWRINLDHP